MINAYSTHWFEQFLETRPYTAQELAFVCRCLPNPPYTHILDLCCGQGRHTNALAAAGYTMTGIDINPLALAKAQTDAPTNVTYRQQDMRHLAQLPGDFDAIICLWQSFGYFDAQTNAQILQQISDKLRRNGRFILDIYNREHFSWQTRTRMAQPKGVPVTICETLADNRLTAHLTYGTDGHEETFSWQLYTAPQIITAAAQVGLDCQLACAFFDEETAVSPQTSSMQFLFQKNETAKR